MKRLLTCLLLMAAGVVNANAFTVSGPAGGGDTPLLHLKNAPRWSANTQSLIASGEAGLGGGLEYSLDDSLCNLNFLEDEITCHDIKMAFKNALTSWSEGHPSIEFTDVSDLIAPAYPLAVLGQSDQGAEIDVYASSGREFPPFINRLIHGYTFFYTKSDQPYSMTNGQMINPTGGRFTSADIRFNTSTKYVMATNADCRTCVHFPSLALHEIGHALGLAHPNEMKAYNLDTDLDPSNRIEINCKAPSQGLIYNPRIDYSAVAVGQNVDGDGRFKRGLTYDDEAGRNALYPDCDVTPIKRPERWGALSLDNSSYIGVSTGHENRDDAINAAQELCQSHSNTVCSAPVSFQSCLSVSGTGRGDAVIEQGATRARARLNALSKCQDRTGRTCRTRQTACAYD